MSFYFACYQLILTYIHTCNIRNSIKLPNNRLSHTTSKWDTAVFATVRLLSYCLKHFLHVLTAIHPIVFHIKEDRNTGRRPCFCWPPLVRLLALLQLCRGACPYTVTWESGVGACKVEHIYSGHRYKRLKTTRKCSETLLLSCSWKGFLFAKSSSLNVL